MMHMFIVQFLAEYNGNIFIIPSNDSMKRVDNTVIRQPKGPDGTKGFIPRRIKVRSPAVVMDLVAYSTVKEIMGETLS